MIPRLLRTAAALAFLSAAPLALAQGTNLTINAKVPFAFVIGGKSFAEGSYRIVHSPGGNPALTLSGPGAGGSTVILSVVTRLARQHTGDAPTASLVFESAGSQRALSEVWIKGRDGFLVSTRETEHGHEVVEVKE